MKLEVDVDLRRSNGFHLAASLRAQAQALAIVGPSGGGKSTLLEAIVGTLPGARVALDGEDLSAFPIHQRRLGYLTQDALLFPHLSVRENLLYSPSAQAPEAIVHALHLDPLLERRPRHLSGGERRRVALGRALLAKPRLLLLDEPFAGLDEQLRREAMSFLLEIQRRFTVPMVIVSHFADEVFGLCDWTVRLEEGKIAAAGPSLDLLSGGAVRVDNFFSGEAIAADTVRVGELSLTAPLPPTQSGPVRLGCYAREILLAKERPKHISARNCFAAKVVDLIPVGAEMLVKLDRAELRALVTRESAKDLQLEKGAEVFCLIKANAISFLGRS